jgi:hypothetical protein
MQEIMKCNGKRESMWKYITREEEDDGSWKLILI